MRRLNLVVCAVVMGLGGLAVSGCHDERGGNEPDTTVTPDTTAVDTTDATDATDATGDSTTPDAADTGVAPDTSVDPDTGDPDTTVVPPDTTMVEDTTPNPCEDNPGDFECPCSSNDDCINELCIEGTDGRICSKTCQESCPEGYDCRQVSFGGDPLSMCVPRFTRICRPCSADSDCLEQFGAGDEACIPDADPANGSFCAASCADTQCPNGYSCNTVADADGVESDRCVPDSGSCDCRPSWEAAGFSTPCSITNDFGTCTGVRSCSAGALTACTGDAPTAEICDLNDNNCNGVVDDLDNVTCELTNEFGTCEGTASCDDNGDQVCAGTEPAAELCNGFDDDCDGETDEEATGCDDARCELIDGLYIAVTASECTGGTCSSPQPQPCGLFSCAGGGDTGETCAEACTDDTFCVAGAFCDNGVCQPSTAGGDPCTEDAECATGHCQNGFCCVEGDCCQTATDCPAEYATPATCNDPSTCSGTREEAQCVLSQCGTAQPIDDDSACGTDTEAVSCSPFDPQFCTGALDQDAPVCPTTCVNDDECIDGFHCDGECVENVPDGGVCDEDSDCVGGRCANGFCCESGDCCSIADDCPDSYRAPATCDDPFTCQGERVDAVCDDNICESDEVQDDSGCGSTVEANTCGPFASVFCTGDVTQGPPQCAFSCTEDSECDAGTHCDTICVADQPDGQACDEPSDCISGYCNNGLCCADGTCCSLATDCPSSFSNPPTCDFPTTCQGERDTAVCTNNQCATEEGQPNDSACTSAIVAKDCGPYPSVSCVGGADQVEPDCATGCSSNGQCDVNAFCDGTECLPKGDDGDACTDDAQCAGGHCQNGFCCASGDCCSNAADCTGAAYSEPSSCTDASECQGERRDPACNSNICELGPPVGDDSACAGQEALTCEFFPSALCTAAVNQSTPTCATSCADDNECDAGANCTNNVCVPDATAGQACATSANCSNGLTCVDGVCCTSTCTGGCQRCDLPGQEGSCSFIADGADPDNECGAVSCTGYFWGYDGDTCHAAADVPNGFCNGAGSCQAPSQACANPEKGSAASTCHPSCQNPNTNTCTGTTAGQCFNVTGGMTSCGTGICATSAPNCVNGVPNAEGCIPLPSSPEVCDGLDNDCDGDTDAADSGLTASDPQACEDQDGVCQGSMKPANRCINGSWAACNNASYGAHSGNFTANADACDFRDNDCDGTVDEGFGSNVDLPDDAFNDTNCDGIDGTISRAIFVRLGGNDASAGTMANPKGSIAAAISAAASTAGKDHIYVSEGLYSGRVTLSNGISIYGGYNADVTTAASPNGWARSDSYITEFRNSTEASGRLIGVQGTNITSATVLDHIRIRTGNAVSSRVSNYAVHCNNCDGLTIRRCDIQSGSAGAGTNGASASTSPAAAGGNGANGALGDDDANYTALGGQGGTSLCGRTGGKGGNGPNGNNNGGAGAAGVSGSSGGSGGSRSGCNGAGDGGPGTTGSAGSNGSNGSGGSGGTIGSGYWTSNSGSNGTAGQHGNGGGGGGGGAGQGGTFCDNGTGNGGGGGGGGGCGGARGLAGTGGGGSFGMFLVSSTGITLQANLISAGSGGVGGSGGGGQPGGARGNRGLGGTKDTDEVGAGGNGGFGGKGGNGGAGGGGAGGPSIAVYRSATSVTMPGNNTLSHSTAGSGGASPGNNGTAGQAKDFQ